MVSLLWWDGHLRIHRRNLARRVRQLLTARKGQRPSAWVDWSETHKYISGWSGYAILAISADAGA